MSTLPFVKMQAQGNDFVIIDDRGKMLPELDAHFVRRLADRKLGIGCDQVLLLLPGDKAEARLRIFNSDGSEAGNCGNGLRCIGYLLLEESGLNTVSIELNERVVQASETDGSIRVEMGVAEVTDRNDVHVDVEMGNPHRVFFAATEVFPKDRNNEIISGQIGDDVYIEIIERGVGHTQACGSGACAVAVAIWTTEQHTRPQKIHMPGGIVTVSGSPDALELSGSVERVFSGEYQLPT
ncbi:MAG TPA: diaminopimelate epimerase [Mariprofundaceae bacterium]|nr:diaminopimelate epimerase [Mariprofundaceae bacterium]